MALCMDSQDVICRGTAYYEVCGSFAPQGFPTPCSFVATSYDVVTAAAHKPVSREPAIRSAHFSHLLVFSGSDFTA